MTVKERMVEALSESVLLSSKTFNLAQKPYKNIVIPVFLLKIMGGGLKNSFCYFGGLKNFDFTLMFRVKQIFYYIPKRKKKDLYNTNKLIKYNRDHSTTKWEWKNVGSH